jgi:uncharacterized membrane protein
MSKENLFVYAAAYANRTDAQADLEAFQDAASEGFVGKYDTAILTKDEKGKVHVQQHGTATKRGAWKGAIAGGLAGLLFPPSILVGSLVGGAAGALAGKVWGGMPKSDLKELGQALNEDETGLIIVGESKLEEYIEKQFKKAKKHVRKAIDARLDDIERELAKS